MIRASMANLITAATVLSVTSEDAGGVYLKANLAEPDRPFLPWRATGASAQRIVIDFGAATALDAIALIRANFLSATVQGNASNSWGSPSYSQAVTVARNPYNRRYQHLHAPTTGAFAYRYLSILIPTQSPVPEGLSPTAAAYFLLGGLWAGALTAAPRNTQFPRITTVEPHYDIQPPHKAWLERLEAGEPVILAAFPFDAVTGDPSPGLADEVRTWGEWQRKVRDAGAVLFQAEDADPSQCWIAQQTSDPAWPLGLGLTQSDLTLMEVTR